MFVVLVLTQTVVAQLSIESSSDDTGQVIEFIDDFLGTLNNNFFNFTGNLTNFTELQDTPNSYSGADGKVLIVSGNEIIFANNVSSGGGGGATINIFNQDLNTTNSVIFSGINITNSSGYNSLFIDSHGKVGINTFSNLLDDLTINGTQDLRHIAMQSDDHALEIEINTQTFGDVKGLFIDYIVGAIGVGTDEEAIFINIDSFASIGGDITGLEIVTTEGGATIHGYTAGVQVNPVFQLSGVFGNMDSALNNTVDVRTELIDNGINTDLFVEDGDTLTLGNAQKFEEIEFILTTVAGGAGIKPEFYFSTGVGTWDVFTPGDGTNGLRDEGVVIWLDSDIPSWDLGTGSEYLIRINRTQGNIPTTPIVSKVQISSADEYFWDKNGFIKVFNLTASELFVNDTAVSRWLYNQTQTVFFYNQTNTAFFYNMTQSPFFYNQTDTAFFYNMSDGIGGDSGLINNTIRNISDDRYLPINANTTQSQGNSQFNWVSGELVLFPGT